MSAHQDFARETWHLNAFNMCEVIVIREGADARGHRYIDGRHQVRVHLYENVQAAANAVRQHNAELSAVAEGSKNTKKRNANGSQSKMNTESIAMTAVSDETGRDAYLPFDAPLWQQYEHRIKWLMARIGMPDSVSLAEAMKQLLNDAEYIRTNRTPAAALSAAPVAQEPVAWQWRYKGPSLAVDDDGWSVWLPIEYSIESFRETFADKIERGTVEYRPLYAGTPPATSAGLGADEIARVFARWKNSKNLHESLAAQNIEKELLALLSRAGDQSHSTHEA